MTIVGLEPVEYRISSFILPNITLGVAEQASQLLGVPHPASQMEFSPLTVSFLADEYLSNYLAVKDWMVGIGSPETRDQYAALGSQVRRDITITLYNAMYKDFAKIKFLDAFPTSLSEVPFTFNETEPEPVVIQAQFFYTLYQVELYA